MKIRLGELRNIIRRVFQEGGPPGASLTSDPTNPEGFYPYEVERGTDIQSFWYKSPGRKAGSEGDPGRPADAEEYIGFKTKGATPADAAELAKPKEE
jgi:hypothetical protein